MVFENKINNIAKVFFDEVYPIIEEVNAYDIFIEKYYKPNKELLDFHYSKWTEFNEIELREMVLNWRKSDFTTLFDKFKILDLKKIRNTLDALQEKLALNGIGLNILVGNFRSGLFMHQNQVFCSIEVLEKYGDLDFLINKGLHHECFHLYHFANLRKRGYRYNDDLIEMLICDGMADYFTYLHFSDIELHELLIMNKDDVKTIEENEALYWNKILNSIECDTVETSIIKFNGTTEMRKKFGLSEEYYPERMSYYYGFKIIEKIVGSNFDLIYEMTQIEPQKIFSKYLEINNIRTDF